MSSGEGAEETAKDAADISAFFKSDCSLPKCEQKVDVPSQLGDEVVSDIPNEKSKVNVYSNDAKSLQLLSLQLPIKNCLYRLEARHKETSENVTYIIYQLDASATPAGFQKLFSVFDWLSVIKWNACWEYTRNYADEFVMTFLRDPKKNGPSSTLRVEFGNTVPFSYHSWSTEGGTLRLPLLSSNPV